MFGPYCKVIGGNHNIGCVDGPMMDAPYLGSGKGIKIENDVWVGAGSTILDGAVLTEGTEVAVGAVVTCQTIPYSVYGGVPAKLIKHRFTKNEIIKVNSSLYTSEELQSYYG
jgi:acetyltransferase-like isoleucine patch superfamily enzyme